MQNPIIEARGIKKTYYLSRHNSVQALRGVDLIVQPGDFSALVGPSGCGKSTLMHILGLLDQADAGELKISGMDARKIKGASAARFRAKKIGFIFQGFNLIPTLTALENVALAAKYGGLKASSRQKRAAEILEEVGLGDRLNHKPSELSGGQQQRVAIARALVNHPDIILADEPTGELDSKTSVEIIELLKKYNKINGQTFLLVTHNPEVAEACKKIIHLRDGQNA